ncbi:MAG: hypothetical protein ACTH0V_05210 [Microbacteriaceae bacterium]
MATQVKAGRTPSRRERRGGGALRKLALSGLVAAVAAVPLIQGIGGADPAEAAVGSSGSVGTGVGWFADYPGHLGAYSADGTNVWCIQTGVTGPATGGGQNGSYTNLGLKGSSYMNSSNDSSGKYTVTDRDVLEANYIMHQYRGTQSRVNAAAVELFVWTKLSPNRAMAEGGAFYPVSNPVEAAKQLSSRAGGSYNGASAAEVRAKLDDLIQEAKGAEMPPAANTSPGTIALTPAADGRTGTLTATLKGPYAGGSWAITLNGGAVDKNGNGVYDEGEPTSATMTNGQSVPIVPLNNTAQQVTASGVATSDKTFFQPQVNVLQTSRGGQKTQSVAYSAAPQTIKSDAVTPPSIEVNPSVRPTVSTQVTEDTQFVVEGESITDQWTVSMGEATPWPAGVEFQVRGTLYGPFEEQPKATDDGRVPEDAPVFEEFELQPVTAGKPTVDVTSKPITEGGYYTFVAGIDYADQNATAKEWLEDGYRHFDAFGLVNETALRIAEVTTDAQDEVVIDGTAVDEAIITGHIPDGTEIEFSLYDNNGTPGDTSDDVLVGTTDLQGVESGVYDNLRIKSQPIPVGNPFEGLTREERIEYAKEHALYWQERLYIGGNVEYEGEPELPNETTDVPNVDVTTKAQEQVGVYGYATDTAIVDGYVAPNARLEFTAYHDAGTPGDLSDDQPVNAEPVTVNVNPVEEGKDGAAVHLDQAEFTSPEVKFEQAGVTYWVERLYFGDTLVHEGEPELPNETTEVVDPEVTTQAQEIASVHGDFHDVATITGRIEPGSTVGFEAFQKVEAGQQKVNDRGELLYDKDTRAPLVWTQDEIDLIEASGGGICEAQPIASLEPVAVEAGVHDGLRVTSANIRTALDAPVYWVETLYSADGDVVHRGECGIPNETTTVDKPEVVTEATPEIILGDAASDTALVNGPVPEGAYLTFELFFIPDGYDAAVNAPSIEVAEEAADTPEAPADTEETPEGEEPAGEEEQPAETEEPAEGDDGSQYVPLADPRLDVPACLDAERVYTSVEEPVSVDAGVNSDARYQSPEYTPAEVGTYFWVETLQSADGDIIHRGDCGAPGETTVVIAPADGAGGGNLAQTGGQTVAPWAIIAALAVAAGITTVIVARRKQA